MKSLFEQTGGTYREAGDYSLPNLVVPKQSERNIGVWGQRKRQYLKEHHRVIYYNYLTKGTLCEHLADVEEQAQYLYSQLVNQLAEKENVTENLKATDTLAWIRKMNNIRNRAMEIVNAELIFI